ncbi:MAG: hypothetical protein AMK73_02240 [Planctomycetes bacterium SM23_32]|nr:MAG: hypothetical protein AMK73_02240 [Planctomycetes bacterium SM23_32]
MAEAASSPPVTVHEPELCSAGYTLFCHTCDPPPPGGRARILLVDMEGGVVHEWRPPTSAQLPELLPDGTLLYSTRDRSHIEGAGLRRLAPDGTVLRHYHCRADHDFHVMDGGRLVVHCIADKMVPRLGPGLRRCPYIVEVEADGRLLWEWRGEEHVDELQELLGRPIPPDWLGRARGELGLVNLDGVFTDSQEEAPVRSRAQHYAFDWAHNNNCEVMPPNRAGRSDPRFAAGNILFSYRTLDTIGIIERSTGRIVWAWGPGELDGQHKPTMLPDGHILIFDNGTRRGWSRVVELDPLAGSIAWEWHGEARGDLYSPYISGADRLPSGNVLICEGGPGRLLEVTREGRLVWEFRSPFAEPETFGIYRAVRYSAEQVEPLLRAAS